MANKNNISDELLAAYFEGNTNREETEQILQTLKTDEELQEVFDIALKMEKESASIIVTDPIFTEETLPRRTSGGHC